MAIGGLFMNMSTGMTVLNVSFLKCYVFKICHFIDMIIKGYMITTWKNLEVLISQEGPT